MKTYEFKNIHAVETATNIMLDEGSFSMAAMIGHIDMYRGCLEDWGTEEEKAHDMAILNKYFNEFISYDIKEGDITEAQVLEAIG